MIYIHAVNAAGLNLNLLPVLDALLAERSVSRAGARLGLSQPAVSNALAQLRALLGDPLLVRRANGMVPTERALALAQPVRAAMLAVEQSLAPAPAFDPAAARRQFVIVANDFVAFALLPRLLARLQRQAPGVRLHLRAFQEHVIPPDLERGEADLLFSFSQTLPPAHQAADLFQDRLVFVARQGHPQVRGRITLAAYTKLAHVIVSHQPNARGVVDDALAAQGRSRQVALRLSHFLLVPHVLAATDYVAALSELVARPLARSLRLQIQKLPLAVPPGTVRMVWHERTSRSPAHVWLRSMVQEIGQDVR